MNKLNLGSLLNAFLILLLVVAIYVVGYAGNDDKFITYFVADSVANGDGILNLNGVHVEQSSSYLLVYILGLVAFVTGLTAADVGYFVSMLFYALCYFPMIHILRHFSLEWRYSIIVLLSPPVLFWATSGMENSLYLFLTLCFVCAVNLVANQRVLQNYLLVILLAALLTLARPEGVAVFIFASVLFALLQNFSRSALLVSGVAIFGALLGIVWRVLHGLSVFPLPVYAKTTAPLSEDILDGFEYLFKVSAKLSPYAGFMLAISFIVAVFVLWESVKSFGSSHPRQKPILSVVAAVFAASLAFAVVAGGDWMPYGRFLTLPFALGGVLLFASIDLKYRKFTAVTVIVLTIFGFNSIVKNWSSSRSLFDHFDVSSVHFSAAQIDANNAIHSRDVVFTDAILEVLSANPKKNITLASIQMGMVPYYLKANTNKELTFLDFRGLATLDVHSCPQIDRPFSYNPYNNLDKIVACGEEGFDYIYDLDRKNYVEAVKAFGCEIIYQERVELKRYDAQRYYAPKTFIADCSALFTTGQDKNPS